MNTIFKMFFLLSFSGSFFILLLFLCKYFLKDKISRRWQYYIWLIVIARLLFPIVPETNLMNHFFQTDNSRVRAEEDVIPLPEQKELLLPDGGNTIETPVAINQEEWKSNSWPMQNGMTLLANIWFVAALLMLIRKITIYQSFVRYIKANQTPVGDVEILDRVSIIAEQMGIKRAMELCTNPILSSPLIFGFFHPCILLPTIEIPEKEFQYTIVHELTHYRKGDMFYKWLVQITVCLHWFNPLVYLMACEINKDCEFACDESIVAKLNFNGIQDYGKTLLHAMALTGKYKEGGVSAMLKENKELLKERLDTMMKFKKSSKKSFCFTICFTLMISFGVFYTGVYGIDPKKEMAIEKESSLILNIENAAIEVEMAEDDKISAQYNREVYDVSMDHQNNKGEIIITCKTKINDNKESIKLFLPDMEYGDIKMNFKNTYFTCSVIQMGNLIADLDTSAVFLTLPKQFVGSVKATVTGGCFELISWDDFKNTDITIAEPDGMGMVFVPDYFTKEGQNSYYANGEQKNKINITKTGIGVVSLSSSDDFKGIRSDFSKEKWKEEWKNTWKEDLKEEWKNDWKNEWKEEWNEEWKNEWSSNLFRLLIFSSANLFQITVDQGSKQSAEKVVENVNEKENIVEKRGFSNWNMKNTN